MDTAAENTVTRAPAWALAISNVVLLATAAAALAFCVYSVANQKSDLLVRLSPAVPALAAPLLLLFRPVFRLTAVAILFGIVTGVYAAQLFALVLIDPDRPSLQATEQAAKETGVRYDGRTRLRVISDERRHGIQAYPPFYPYFLLDSPLMVNGVPTVPLASLSNARTVCCNEGGQYLTYTTDEHGFVNPPGSWSMSNVDIAFVGGSTAVGESVPAEDNLLWQLRARYPRTVTLGAGGNGPLLELATVREYLGVWKPKRVLWMFAESNSPGYLETEQQSGLLLRYLDSSFRQGLLEEQPALDQAIAKYFEDGMQTEAVAESWTTAIKRFVLLKNIRTVLYYFVTARTAPPKPFQFNSDLYEQVLREGQRTIGEWGGKITLVYFPDSSRYAGVCNYSPALRQVYDRTHEAVLKVANSLSIPVIDLSKAFPDLPASQASTDEQYFYSFPAHYKPAGYHLAGREILSALEAQDSGRPGGIQP